MPRICPDSPNDLHIGGKLVTGAYLRHMGLVIFSGAALALVSGSACASGNIAKGKSKSTTCSACHGKDGNSIDPQYPRLAGQYQAYLLQAMREYRSGDRNNAVMKGFVANLSEQDLEDLASYYASLPGKVRTLQGQIQGD